MTGIFVSAVFKPEKEFGVEDTTADWQRLPSGLTVTYQPKNNLKTYYEIGNKFMRRAVAGNFSGTFTLNFKMDYQCIDILGAVFEDYNYINETHIFKKVNGKRIPSFTLRIKKLNRIRGGSADTTITLTGCVANSFQMAQSGSSDATSNATISGNYADEDMVKTDLDGTDWEDFYDVEDAFVPMEWTCVNIGDTPVAYTESASFGVNNSASMVPGCGSRFAHQYSEGQAQISLSTSCWSVNPEVYYQRMYSGGYRNTDTAPLSKGLKPIPLMKLKSSLESAYSITVNLYKVYVESDGSRSYTANGRIMDSPQFQVTNFDIEIKNTRGKITIWD